MRCLILFILCWIALPVHADKLEVRLSGLSTKLSEYVQTHLNILTISEAKEDLAVARIKGLYQQALVELPDVLSGQGYYDSHLEGKLIQQDKLWIADFEVTLGQPVHVTDVKVKITGAGKTDPHLQQLITQFQQKKIGKRLKHQDYENFKEDLLITAHQQGWLDACLVHHTIIVNRDTHDAHIDLILATGQPYQIAEIIFNSQATPQDFLQRYVTFAVGDRFLMTRILELQQNLAQSDLFRSVRVNYRENREEKTVVIQVDLLMKPKNRYTGSVGFGTNTLFRGKLSWQRRFVFYPGHLFGVNVGAYQHYRTVNAHYIVLGDQPNADHTRLDMRTTRDTLNDTYSSRTECSITKVLKRSFHSRWTLRYLDEAYRNTVSCERKHSRFLLPSLGIIFTKAQPTEYFDIGYQLKLYFRAGVGLLFSTANILQYEARLKMINLLTPQTRLILKATLGVTHTNNYDDIPQSLRFFTGGDYSIRGFSYKAISPFIVDSVADKRIAVGGLYLIEGSVECEHYFINHWSGALFLDAGNAMKTLDHPFACLSVGLGLRWHSPIGPLRVDFGVPLRAIQRYYHKGWRLHINFTPDW